jgi:hypothetical protein
MKQSSDLFELIKSMDRNEKRYFRLYASLQKGSKNYIELFNAIDKQKQYDEHLLRRKYHKEKFISQLAFTKNYLYKLLMKSLINYREENSADSKIHSLISQCKILFGKALYRQYFKTIIRAKEFAIEHERFGYYLQILDMEKIITPKEEIRTVKSNTIYNEAIACTEKIKNTFEYSRIAGLLLNNFRTYGTSREIKQVENVNTIVDESVISIENAQSERAKEIYYWIMEISYNIKADYGKMFDALEKRYNIVVSNPAPFEDNIIDYKLDILCSIVDTCLKLNKIEEARKYLKYINKTAGLKSKADKIDNDIFTLFANFRIYLKYGEINKAVRQIPLLEKRMDMYRNKLLIDTELSIRFYIVKCRILEKNFNEALSAANLLHAHPLLDKREDYECYLSILNLVIHFELKNYTLLRYLIISTYRFLYKREKLYKLEMLILEFIRKLPRVKNDDDLAYSFEQFKKKLTMLKKDKYERNAFEYFDFLSWIEEKYMQDNLEIKTEIV